jgi:hypothetical protein
MFIFQILGLGYCFFRIRLNFRLIFVKILYFQIMLLLINHLLGNIRIFNRKKD